MQKNREKNQQPDAIGNQESSSNRHTIKESVYQHPDERGNADHRIYHLIVMGFFAKVEMRRKSVLEHVHDHIAQQNQRRCASSVRAKLVGIISRNTVPSMKPEPSAMK